MRQQYWQPPLPWLKNHLAWLCPPLGWNSWNTFGTDINEKLVKEVADAFMKYGLKDAGYEYIVLDDGWRNSF